MEAGFTVGAPDGADVRNNMSDLPAEPWESVPKTVQARAKSGFSGCYGSDFWPKPTCARLRRTGQAAADTRPGSPNHL